MDIVNKVSPKAKYILKKDEKRDSQKSPLAVYDGVERKGSQMSLKGQIVGYVEGGHRIIKKTPKKIKVKKKFIPKEQPNVPTPFETTQANFNDTLRA